MGPANPQSAVAIVAPNTSASAITTLPSIATGAAAAAERRRRGVRSCRRLCGTSAFRRMPPAINFGEQRRHGQPPWHETRWAASPSNVRGALGGAANRTESANDNLAPGGAPKRLRRG